MFEDFGSLERLLEDTQLTEREVRPALVYPARCTTAPRSNQHGLRRNPDRLNARRQLGRCDWPSGGDACGGRRGRCRVGRGQHRDGPVDDCGVNLVDAGVIVGRVRW